MYVCRFQNVVLRCPTPRLHCFLSSHWLHLGFFRFWSPLYLSSSFSSVFLVLSYVSASTSMLFWVTFLLPFFEHGRTRLSLFCSIYFIIGSSNPICCFIVTFLILYFFDILEDLLRAPISVDSTHLL